MQLPHGLAGGPDVHDERQADSPVRSYRDQTALAARRRLDRLFQLGDLLVGFLEADRQYGVPYIVGISLGQLGLDLVDCPFEHGHRTDQVQPQFAVRLHPLDLVQRRVKREADNHHVFYLELVRFTSLVSDVVDDLKLVALAQPVVPAYNVRDGYFLRGPILPQERLGQHRRSIDLLGLTAR